MSTTPAGWYPDPNAPGSQRYWDGNAWTEQMSAAAPPSPPAPPARAKKRRKWPWILLALLALLVIASVASGGGDKKSDSPSDDNADTSEQPTETPAGASDEVDDVAITSCTRNIIGFGEATFTVTNNSSKPSTYSIEIAVESADGTTSYGTANAFVQRLNAGQTTTDKASGLQDVPEGVQLKCTVSDVNRSEAM